MLMLKKKGKLTDWEIFSFLYFLKIKISKIYVRFEIFQKYPPVAPHRATGKCNFFFQIRNEVPGKKRPCRPPNGRQGPVAQPTGDRGLSPVGGGDRSFLFFFQGPILSYSSVQSSSSSAGSRPLTPTAPNLSFIKSREKIARTSLISRALWNPQT